jgi:hypothetical protein
MGLVGEVWMIALEVGGRRVHVSIGAHACQLATSAREAEQTALAFVRDGLRAGERCVTLVPPAVADALCAHLGTSDIDPADAVGSGRLVVDSTDGHTVAGRQFDPYRLVARHLTDVGSSGATRLRILVDMDWYAGAGSSEGVLRYEAACHAALQSCAGRMVVLAQYRYGDLLGDTVIDILRLHPLTVIAQHLRRNPNPADPVTFMARLLHRASARNARGYVQAR